MWEEHMWGQPPPTVRRAQLDLDLTLHAKIASTPPPLQVRLMHARAWKIPRPSHRSGVRRLPIFIAITPDGSRQMEREDTLSAIAAHPPRPGPFSASSPTCSFFAEVFPCSPNLGWHWDCFSRSRAVPWCVLPSLCTGFVTKSGRISDSFPIGGFRSELALFLYIEGFRAASSQTPGPFLGYLSYVLTFPQ